MAGRRPCRPMLDRFHELVDRTTTPDGCWPYLGRLDQDGYGTISVGGNRGRYRRAAQVAWEVEHGQPFPVGKLACHTCDNPPCARGSHVFPGTVVENNRDRDRKGRAAVGERHHNARLTRSQVEEMRRRADEGESQAALAIDFDVTDGHVNNIVRRRVWLA